MPPMSGVVMIINLYFYYQISADVQSHRGGTIIIIYVFSLGKGRMMTLFYHKKSDCVSDDNVNND